MTILKPTGFTGTIVWLGRVADREAGLTSTPVERLHLGFAGPEGEAHGGLTRPSCSRVKAQYPRDTEIRNTRQLSVLSAEDLDRIAANMGLDALDPGLIGATMVIRGIPDLSHLPPSSRLQAKGGATLVVDLENRPCMLPAKPIEAAHPGFGARFKRAAEGLRGFVGWVEREGELHLGAQIRLHVPDQPVWAHLSAARQS